MLTCKDFLSELNELFDDATDPKLKAELEQHLSACPNCWVVADTTKRTLNIFHGLEARAVPENVKSRLMDALARKMAEKKGLAGNS